MKSLGTSDSWPKKASAAFFSASSPSSPWTTNPRNPEKITAGIGRYSWDSPGKKCYRGIHMNSYLSRAISEQIWFMKFMVPKYWKETRKGENVHDDKLSFWWGQYVFVIFLLNLQSVVFPVILSILMICPLWGLGVNKLSSSHSLSRPSK